MTNFNKILFLILIIILTSMVLSKNVNQEAFIPRKVKEIYRPIARNIRINYEGFYNKSSTNISNILRKIGIL